MTMVRVLFLSLLMITFCNGCSSTVRYALLGTRAFPTTEGEARIEPNDDGGYEIAIEVDNLPGFDRLGAGLTTFVVWLTPTGADTPDRAGVLEVDPLTRTGTLVANTRAASLQVRVSAEPDANVTEPSEFIVVDALLEADD
jgi:hypothetical protein